VGVPSAPQNVALVNTGTAPLVIRSVTVAGPDRADFAISEGGSGITVPEGSSRAVSVVFTPSRAGKRTARLVVSDNATGSPNEVPLEGTGIAATLIEGDWSVYRHDPRQLGLAEAALDPRPLQPWSFPLEGRPGGVVVRGGVAYVGTETGSLVAVDTRTRAERWHRALPNPIRSSAAVGAQGVVVSARGLYCLGAADGLIRWQRADVIAEPEASPMLVGEVLYVAAPAASDTQSTRRWAVYAIDSRNGRNAWLSPALLPEGYDARGAVAAYPEIGLLFVYLRPSG
jgi:outer membrane protein assembly factor BamB